MRPEHRTSFRAGVRVGIPFAAASLLLGISFGVLAEPVMGHVAPIVMSAIVFAGSAQFAATAVLADGGSAATAVVAGILLNARFLPMGIAIAPSCHGGALRRTLTGQGIIDVSWALANRGGGRFEIPYMLGITVTNYPAWVFGTAAGVFGGELIGDPADFGLDAIFPAFFLGLLANELRASVTSERRRREAGDFRRGEAPRYLSVAAAVIGAAVALALTPFTPPGVPVLAACAGALLGLRWR